MGHFSITMSNYHMVIGFLKRNCYGCFYGYLIIYEKFMGYLTNNSQLNMAHPYSPYENI